MRAYEPPRPLKTIEADIKALEDDIVKLLKEVTAWPQAIATRKERGQPCPPGLGTAGGEQADEAVRAPNEGCP